MSFHGIFFQRFKRIFRRGFCIGIVTATTQLVLNLVLSTAFIAAFVNFVVLPILSGLSDAAERASDAFQSSSALFHVF